MARGPLSLLTFLLLPAALPAQQHKAPPAYPERDILSPFRKCGEIYAPPDAVFAELRIMRGRAEQPGAKLHFNDDGREICDDQPWFDARERLRKLTVDAGYLAEIMRRSRNADERDLAFYGAFLCADPAVVFNLISHIPGEPSVQTRQKAYPRAIAFLRAHIGRQWGGLTDEQKQAMNLPAVGSPAAQAAGITREPGDKDYLYSLRLRPFFQLLDLDTPIDQAQGLWFLKECFAIRKDLAKAWLEPALPRLRELLVSDQSLVREQAIALLSVLAPKLKAPKASEDPETLAAWGEQAIHTEFPPVRVISEGLVVLWPCEERAALAQAAVAALSTGGCTDMVNAKTTSGQAYRGLRISRVPKELEALPFKAGMVITMLNGTPVQDANQLVELATRILKPKDPEAPVRGQLVFDYVLGDQSRALEVRVM